MKDSVVLSKLGAFRGGVFRWRATSRRMGVLLHRVVQCTVQTGSIASGCERDGNLS